MIVPPEKLQPDVLNAIIESYVTREGTDYGHSSFSLAQKVSHIHPKINSGAIVIVFDEETESVTLMERAEYAAMRQEAEKLNDRVSEPYVSYSIKDQKLPRDAYDEYFDAPPDYDD